MARPFPTLGQAVLLLAAAWGLQAGMAYLLMTLWPAWPAVLRAGVSNLAALLPVALWGFGAMGGGPSWSSVPRSGRFVLGTLLAAAGGTVILGEAGNWMTAIAPLPPALADLFNQLSGGAWAVSLFTLSLVAPITEEALFRGVLLRGFARRWGPGPGLVLSAALFGLFHLNLWQAPTAFVAGLYLGWVFLKTQSLLYPILIHATFNGLPVLLSALGWEIPGYNTPLVPGMVELQPVWWVLGGALLLAGGVLLSIRWAPLSPPPVSDTVAP